MGVVVFGQKLPFFTLMSLMGCFFAFGPPVPGCHCRHVGCTENHKQVACRPGRTEVAATTNGGIMIATLEVASLADRLKDMPPTISQKDISRAIGVPVNSLRRWIRQDKFPRPLALGSWPRWNRDTVAAFFRRLEAEAGRE